MSASPSRHRVALAVALAGVALSAVTLFVHERIATDAGYTSFCNLGGAINCDVVLGSRYGRLLGVPVALLALVTFALGAALALPGAVGARADLADLALVGLASASVGFAFVLGVVMAAVLHHACLLCLGTDVIIAAWFVTVMPLAGRFDAAARGGWWTGRVTARTVAAAALVLAVAGGTLAAVHQPPPATNLAEVRQRDPQFVDWWDSLHIVPVRELTAGEEHTKGPNDAAITIVEFSDFECPHCAEAFPDLRKLVRSRSDVRLVFRHYPLDSSCNATLPGPLHPNACLAAVAAECASEQGRFWEYHDVLFENHEHLERESLFRYARELGLELATFRSCLDDPATRARVGQDVDVGNRVGIDSTPTLFFNGRKVAGALDHTHYEYALIIEKERREAHTAKGGS